MKSQSQISPFLFFNISWLVIGAILILLIAKGDLVLFLNKNHSVIADILFKYGTFLGTGWSLLILIIITFFLRFKYSIISLIALINNGLLSYLFKHVLFNNTLRPTHFFPKEAFYHFIDGFSYHGYHSFPSGHTMTAFTICTLLTLWFPNRWMAIACSFFALFVGISRMYLLQHFWIDVYFGGLLGITSALIAQHIDNKLSPFLNQKFYSSKLLLSIQPTESPLG